MVWYAVIAASAVCSSFSMSSELIRPPPPDMPPVEGVRVSRMKSTQRMVMLKFSKQVKRRCEGDEGERERGEEGKRGRERKGEGVGERGGWRSKRARREESSRSLGCQARIPNPTQYNHRLAK